MERFTNWHKLLIGKIQNLLRINNYEMVWLSWIKGFIMGLLLMSLLSGCYGTYYVTDQTQYDHPTEVYYHNDLPYWGFYNDYYYYYGKPHLYPWWYYYTLIPQYTYSVHTHVTVYCDNGYYVSKPRGPKFNNNRGGIYKPINKNTVKNNRTNIRTNTNRTNVKVNTNRINIKTNKNTNKSNVNRNNINKNNIKVNRSNQNRTNINKSKNTNRSNRSNTRKPR